MLSLAVVWSIAVVGSSLGFADQFGKCDNTLNGHHQILVKIKTEASFVDTGLSSDAALERRARALGRLQSAPWDYREYQPRLDIHSLQLKLLVNQDSAARELYQTGDYDFVRKNCLYAPALTPNDAQFATQAHHGIIDSEDAWDLTTGRSAVTIAIVDSGVDITQEDLTGRTVAGFNSVSCNPTDAAGCGSIAPVEAAVLASNECAYHGTRVAGVAASTGNNTVGVAGVAFAGQIMPIRISNLADCTSNALYMAEAIIWAAEHGAKVINVSYSGVYDPTIQAASSVARSLGSLVVFAAGNNGVDLLAECTAAFSAALCSPYTLDDILVVGATDASLLSNALASFSNDGAWIDMVAPGEDILTNDIGNTYDIIDGTSFSAPMVSGAALLIYSLFPDINPGDVEDILMQSSTDLGTSGEDDTFGFGRLNVADALTLATSGVLNSDRADNQALDLRLPRGPAKIGMTDTPARGGAQSRAVIFAHDNPGILSTSHYEVDSRRISISELPRDAIVGRGSLFYRKDDESEDFVFTNNSRTSVYLGSFTAFGGSSLGPPVIHQSPCGNFSEISDLHLTENAAGTTLHLVVADKGAGTVSSYTLNRTSDTLCSLNTSVSLTGPEWIRSINGANPRIYVGYRSSTGLYVRAFQNSDLSVISTSTLITASPSALFGRPYLDPTNSDLWVPIAYANDSQGSDYLVRFTSAGFPPATNVTISTPASPRQILQDFEGVNRLLYILCPQHRKIQILDTSGAQVSTINTTFTPRKIFVTSDGTYRYVAALRGDAKISIFRADATVAPAEFSESVINLAAVMDDLGGFSSLDEVLLTSQSKNLISVVDLAALSVDYHNYLPRGVNAMAAQSRFATHFVSTQADSAYTLDELKNGAWRLTQYPVGDSPIQIAYRTNRLYTLNRDDDTVTAIDLTDGETLTLALPVGARPQGFEISSALDRLWTANTGTQSITEINISNAGVGPHGGAALTESIVQTLALGFSPRKILYQSSDDSLYVAGPTQVRVYDGSAMTSVATQTLSTGVSDIALRTGGIWITSSRGPSVTVMDRSTFTTTNLTASPQALTSNQSVGVVGLMNNRQIRTSSGYTYLLTSFTKLVSSLTNLFAYDPSDRSIEIFPYAQMASSGAAGSRIRITHEFDVNATDTSGNLWLASSQQLLVQRITSNLQIETVKDISRSLPIDIISHAAENRIFVLSRNLNLLFAYDTINGTLKRTSVCEAPTKLTLDTINNRLYVLCAQLNAFASLALNDVGDVLSQTLYRTGSQPVDMIFDSASDQLYVLNQASDSVWIYEPSNLNTAPTIVALTDKPSAMALDTSSGDLTIFHRASRVRTSLDGPTLVATTASIGNFGFTQAQINSSTNTVYASSASPKLNYTPPSLTFTLTGPSLTTPESYATEIAISPSQDKSYFVYPEDDMVRIFTESGASSTYRDVAVGVRPRSLLVSDTTNRVYITNFADDTVSILSTTTNAVLATASLTSGCGPSKMALTSVSGTNYVYVICESNETVEVINATTYAVGTPFNLDLD